MTIKREGRPRVLIVEDDDATRELVRTRMRDEPFDIVYAEDARRALLAYFQAEEAGTDFDAVLLDVSMKEKDGFKVGQLIRLWEEGGTREIKMGVFTAYADLVNQSNLLLKLKVSVFWKKPSDVMRLPQLFKSWLFEEVD